MIYNKQQAAEIKALEVGDTLNLDEREGNRIRALLAYYKKFNGKTYSCKGQIENTLTIKRTK